MSKSSQKLLECPRKPPRSIPKVRFPSIYIQRGLQPSDPGQVPRGSLDPRRLLFESRRLVCPEYRCSCSVFQVHSCFLLLEVHSSFHFPCSVYLWNASTASVNRLCDLGDSGDTVTSVSWAERVREATRAACVIRLSASTQGTHLAVGSSSGMVQIWDVTKSRVIRELAGHRQRVRGLQKSE